MSDFPGPEQYRLPHSTGHLRLNNTHGLNALTPFVIKREKGAYLYDIDNYKYIDFYLNEGSVIYGHTYGKLTHYIKNALSVGITSAYIHKFHYRLLRNFQTITDFQFISFYNTWETALMALLLKLKPVKIGVSSQYLLQKISPFILNGQIEIANRKTEYDACFIEPINFDGRLEDTRPNNYQSKTIISVENRTAFRFQYGFTHNPRSVDYILSANNIANGMDCAVILNSASALPSENIPAYKAVAITETLKLYRRNVDYSNFGIPVKSPEIKAQCGSIFILKKEADMKKLNSHGICLTGNTGYLSVNHTEHDIARLIRAFKK